MVEIKVRNVSTAGFMAECAAPVRIGSYVMLDIPGIGPVEAQVRWQIGVQDGRDVPRPDQPQALRMDGRESQGGRFGLSRGAA